MSYIGRQPVPQATRYQTEGVVDSPTHVIHVIGGYGVDNIHVYINGSLAPKDEYTAEDGVTVTFNEELLEGTKYLIEEYRTFEPSKLNADHLLSGTVPNARLPIAATAEAIDGTAGVLPDAAGVKAHVDSRIATEQQAINGTAGVLPDAAGVHAAFKQFGLGSSESPPTGYDFNHALEFSGTISPTLGGNATNAPYNSWGGVFTYKNDQNSQAGQIYLSNAPNSGATEPQAHIRTRPANGTVTPWRELYHTGNILGTVSQSGGVPTGAIIQRGSNANGEFVRFADGTQICWSATTMQGTTNATSIAGLFRSGGTIWSFPAVFAGGGGISVSDGVGRPVSDTIEVWGAVRESDSTTAVIRIYSSTNSPNVAAVARPIAMGRWF